MVGENSTHYDRPTAKRPSFNPQPFGPGSNSTFSKRGIVANRMDILARQLAKAIQSTCEATGFMVHGVNQVGGRRLATVDIGTTTPLEGHQREAVFSAIARVWNSYTYSERAGLGYEVTLNGERLSSCR